jgi:hypothetical protein
MEIINDIEKIKNLKKINDLDKEIFINARKMCNIDLCKNMSIFSNSGNYLDIDIFKYYKIDMNIFYVKNIQLFIDENKKILFYSNYKFHNFGCLIEIIDSLLILIEEIDLNKNIFIDKNIISCEKWFSTYGHLKDELFKIFYVCDNYFNDAVPFFYSPAFIKSLSYNNSNILLISDIIFNLNCVNADLYNSNLLKFNGLILLQHRYNDASFHFFPKKITNKILNSIVNNNTSKKYNQNVFITRGMHYICHEI